MSAIPCEGWRDHPASEQRTLHAMNGRGRLPTIAAFVSHAAFCSTLWPAVVLKVILSMPDFNPPEMIASALRDRAKDERSWPHPSPMDIEFAVLCEKAADVLMEKRKPFQSITAGVETGMAGALEIYNNPDHVMIECPDGTSIRVGRENFNESKAEE